MATSSRKKKSSGKNRGLRYALLLVAGLCLVGVYFLFAPNTGSFSKGKYLYIHTGATYETVKKALVDGHFIRDVNSFDLLAKNAGYPKKIYPGKYELHPGMSNFNIVRLLRSGRQTPVKLVIGKLRLKQDFIRLLGNNLEADSEVLKQMFRDTTYLAQFGLDTNTVLCGVLPNTYEFYWNTTADKAFRKIEKAYAGFWNEQRKAQARSKNLSPQQVIIMASIIEEESNKKTDKPLIASVYLNRLKTGMKLGADPTAKYAYGDFTLRRITSAQTGLVSPYNTYQVSGLPIGPICTPSAVSIDAVLQAPATTYLYFCAKEDGSGYHRFASTYAEHLKNASLYHQSLNQRNIH